MGSQVMLMQSEDTWPTGLEVLGILRLLDNIGGLWWCSGPTELCLFEKPHSVEIEPRLGIC